MRQNLRRRKSYGALHRRRQRKDLKAQSGLGINHGVERLDTSREHKSLRFPCQISDLGGTRKQLGEDAESAKPTQDKMTRLRLQESKSVFVI